MQLELEAGTPHKHQQRKVSFQKGKKAPTTLTGRHGARDGTQANTRKSRNDCIDAHGDPCLLSFFSFWTKKVRSERLDFSLCDLRYWIDGCAKHVTCGIVVDLLPSCSYHVAHVCMCIFVCATSYNNHRQDGNWDTDVPQEFDGRNHKSGR